MDGQAKPILAAPVFICGRKLANSPRTDARRRALPRLPLPPYPSPVIAIRQLAEKHANIATGRHFAARERLEVIPLAQPILVGRHSEKRAFHFETTEQETYPSFLQPLQQKPPLTSFPYLTYAQRRVIWRSGVVNLPVANNSSNKRNSYRATPP